MPSIICGGWNKGIPRTEKQRKEHSEKLKKRHANGEIEPWNKGKIGVYSDETRLKISEAGKNRIVSEETREKLRQNALKGIEGFTKPISERLTFTCEHCKKDFDVPVYQKREAKFCSWECRKEHTQIKIECERCGKIFGVKPCRANKYNVRFCSRECQYPK